MHSCPTYSLCHLSRPQLTPQTLSSHISKSTIIAIRHNIYGLHFLLGRKQGIREGERVTASCAIVNLVLVLVVVAVVEGVLSVELAAHDVAAAADEI